MDDPATTSALGIDADRIFSAAFALRAGFAALRGVPGAELPPIDAWHPLRIMALFLIVVAAGAWARSPVPSSQHWDSACWRRRPAPSRPTILFLLAVMTMLSLRLRGRMGRG